MRVANTTVKNEHTGKVHWGTVDLKTKTVTRTHCNKPVGPHYSVVKGVRIDCQVCITKMTGKRSYRRDRRR
jgi:hypothetical protein